MQIFLESTHLGEFVSLYVLQLGFSEAKLQNETNVNGRFFALLSSTYFATGLSPFCFNRTR